MNLRLYSVCDAVTPVSGPSLLAFPRLQPPSRAPVSEPRVTTQTRARAHTGDGIETLNSGDPSSRLLSRVLAITQ